MEFSQALERFGFRRSDERRLSRDEIYVAHPNRYMTYHVHTYPDGTALFTWEFAIADYLAEHGIQVGSDEALNQFMYPRMDVRGKQDPAWLTAAIDHAEGMLSSVRLDRPE